MKSDNWLTKIAKPIRIHQQMEEFASRVMLAIKEIGDIAGTYNKQTIQHNEVFFSEPLWIEPYPQIWVSVMFVDPGTNPDKLADAETPTWRGDKSGSIECRIRIYDTIPPKNFLGDIKRAILHELVHCIDPKLNKPDLFNAQWHKKNRQYMQNPGYAKSREYYVAPWEQDAYMSSDAYYMVDMWKRNNVPFMRVIEELQKHLPESNAAREYNKTPKLWRRFMQAMWQAVEQIYADDMPKNRQQRQKIENDWHDYINTPVTHLTQSKPMPLPSTVGTEPGLGAGVIDRSMTQQSADAIKQEHPEMRWLGRGNSGVAYECKPGVVCKITGNLTEAKRALHFKQNPHPNVVGILDVKKVQDYPQLWIVYSDLISPMSAEQVDICESLEECYNYSSWSLDTPCIAIKTRKLIANGYSPEVVNRMSADYTEICNIKEIRPADPHPDNLGLNKQGRLVIFDLG